MGHKAAVVLTGRVSDLKRMLGRLVVHPEMPMIAWKKRGSDWAVPMSNRFVGTSVLGGDYRPRGYICVRGFMLESIAFHLVL